MRWPLLLVMLVGCGRIGFDPLTAGNGDGDGGTGDGKLGDGSSGVGPTFEDGVHVEAGSSTGLNPTLVTSVQANDLILVVIGWRDATTTVTSVTDNQATPYSVRANLQTSNGAVSQVIYGGFAASPSSSVSISIVFSAAAPMATARVLLYRGASTNLGSGNFSGNTSTIMASAFLFQSGVVVAAETATQAATVGPNYTVRVTSGFGDIAEDRATTSGIQNATATLPSGVPWVMQTLSLISP